MNNLVSILTPLHNSGNFVEDTIKSVINQTYTNWEMIIVDDGSMDEGPEIAKRYAEEDDRIKLFKNGCNLGPVFSRNRALVEAKGRYIAFLDSDDLWLPQKLTQQICFMEANQYVFTFTAYYKISENNRPRSFQNVPSRVGYTNLLKTCPIGCLTVIYDTQVLGKLFMPVISKRQDYALWLKILKIIPFGYGFDEKLSVYRLRKSSVSSNKFKSAFYQWKVYREIERLNFFCSIKYFLHYALNGLLKTYL